MTMLLITGESLAGLPEIQPFDGLIVDTNFTRHLGWAGEGARPFEVIDKVDGFMTYAMDDGYRRLGLWLLHLVLSGRDWAGLELIHPKSRVSWLYAEILSPLASVYGLQQSMRSDAYRYGPQEVWRHPFAGPDMTRVPRVEPADRPRFAYGWSQPDPTCQHDRRAADQLILQATAHGMAALGALLVDFPHAVLGAEEIDIEVPDIGFAATQPRSIEARFWRQGSIGFPEESLDAVHIAPWPEDRPD